MLIHGNSENFFKWIFRTKDQLNTIVFIFVSKINANNARFLPLFENTRNIRLIYFPGLPIKYSDRITIRIFSYLQALFSSKISKYKVIHFFDLSINFQNRIQILHIDDPVYSEEYIYKIRAWEDKCLSRNQYSKIVTTNTYIANWLMDHTRSSKIIIIEQGFHDLELNTDKEVKKDFICGYSSAYLNYGKDRDANHVTYGVRTLVDEIIPKLFHQDPSIKIYLIGKLGRNAKKALENYPNVVTFGRVNFDKNIELLAKCTVGIYPRKIDNRRSVLKIFTYIGAGIPVVTFDLVDTEIVKQKSFGISVKESDQFVEKIIELKNDPKILEYFQTNIKQYKKEYTWKNLAQKMENLAD